jgi:hypothetical protein
VNSKRRWYERNPIIADAMHAWEHFSPPMQRALAIYIHTLIKDKEVVVQYRGIYSLAPKRLITLYQTRKKGRWYDQDPLVRKVMNNLILASYGDLIYISQRIIHLRKYLREVNITGERHAAKDLVPIVAKVFEGPLYL